MKDKLPHASYISVTPARDFRRELKPNQIIRQIKGDEILLTLIYHQRHGFAWAVEQPGVSADAVVYSRDAFEARVAALADVGVRVFVEIRRMIHADNATCAVGPRAKVWGRSYAMHSADVLPPVAIVAARQAALQGAPL